LSTEESMVRGKRSRITERLTANLAHNITATRLRRPSSRPRFPYTTLFRSSSSAICSADNVRSGSHLSAGRDPVAQRCQNGIKLLDRKSTRLNSSHGSILYAGLCLYKKNPCIP